MFSFWGWVLFFYVLGGVEVFLMFWAGDRGVLSWFDRLLVWVFLPVMFFLFLVFVMLCSVFRLFY